MLIAWSPLIYDTSVNQPHVKYHGNNVGCRLSDETGYDGTINSLPSIGSDIYHGINVWRWLSDDIRYNGKGAVNLISDLLYHGNNVDYPMILDTMAQSTSDLIISALKYHGGGIWHWLSDETRVCHGTTVISDLKYHGTNIGRWLSDETRYNGWWNSDLVSNLIYHGGDVWRWLYDESRYDSPSNNYIMIYSEISWWWYLTVIIRWNWIQYGWWNSDLVSALIYRGDNVWRWLYDESKCGGPSNT